MAYKYIDVSHLYNSFLFLFKLNLKIMNTYGTRAIEFSVFFNHMYQLRKIISKGEIKDLLHILINLLSGM
jgi:hypothetical protein